MKTSAKKEIVLLHIIPELLQMKKMPRSPRESLDAVRTVLFRSQMHNISQNIPYYRKFFQANKLSPDDFRTIDDLRILPIIEKRDIRGDPDMFFNVKIKRKKCYASHTSGSTGEPFWSYFDQRTWIRKKYLSKLRARFACGLRPGEKIAIFTTEHPAQVELSNRKRFPRDLLLKTVFFSVFEDPESALYRFCEFKPHNAYGPPGYFFHLAQVASRKKISTPFLKRIFTSAEIKMNPVFESIKEVFRADVYDIYGSTEFKEVAWECNRHQGYHINEDEVVCEILSPDARTPTGAVGDIVLTDLINRAMPLIRYRIGDKGRMLDKKCSCGRTFALMHPVSGRSSQYLLLSDGRQLSPYLLTTAIEKFPGLLQYQFVQRTRNDLLVKVVLDDGHKRQLSDIQKIVREAVNEPMNIEVEQTRIISAEENGKFVVVKSLLSADFHRADKETD
jgi:phenylacetate-CoA ligase